MTFFGKFEISTMLCVLLVGCTGLRGCDAIGVRSAKLMQGSVEVLGSWEIDLQEISGVGLRKTVGDVGGAAAAGAAAVSGAAAGAVAVDEVFFVSDDATELMVGSGVIGRDWEKSLRRVALAGTGAAPSHFEATAGDVSGLIAVLSEETSRLDYFKGDGSLVKSVMLRIPEDSPLRGDWDADSGSRGEGIVLLNNGHVLLLKEKNPALVIEFGPATDSASGYEPGDAMVSTILAPPRKMGGGARSGASAGASASAGSGNVKPDVDRFKDAEFVPLKWWRPTSSAKDEAHDLSELTVGSMGRLIALSDRDAAIFEVEKKLDAVEEKFHFKCRWDLPAQVIKPEGLVALRDGSFLVAIDRKKGGPNVYRIQLGACI